MKYEIEFSKDAEVHLDGFSSRKQRILLAAIDEQLSFQPDTPTRNRKLLRENPLATWELRVQGLRVFYNVDEGKVLIIALGIKDGNKIIINGEEYKL